MDSKIGSNWRPPEGWDNPYTVPDRALTAAALHNAFEAGASAIIPFVRAATIKEVGELLVQWKQSYPIRRWWVAKSGDESLIHLGDDKPLRCVIMPEEVYQAVLHGEMLKKVE